MWRIRQTMPSTCSTRKNTCSPFPTCAASLPPGAKALVYCAWGFEIGGDAAAKLRARGIDAVAVAGGIGAWRADGLPTEPLKEGDAK